MKAENVSLFFIVVFLAFAGLGIFSVSGAFAQNADEAAAVKDRYEKLLAEYSKGAMKPSKTTPSATGFSIKKNMLSKELKALLLKDEACAKKSDGMCRLDFDFLFNAQDVCKPLKVIDVSQKENIFIMQVSNRFEKCDKEGYYKPYDFTLVNEAGAWVIDDVVYTQKDDDGKIKHFTLKEILKGK